LTLRPRLLVVTPDFPPARGGIQLLTDRVVRHASQFDARIVAVDLPGAAEWDAEHGRDVVRTPQLPNHRLSILALNAFAVREARRFRPDVVLAAHVVGGPALRAISCLLQVPTVVYLHGKEVRASPGLARFAVSSATAVIAVSRYTRSLALGVGAAPEKIHRIPPGADMIDRVLAPRKAARPTIVTIARLEDRYKGHDVLCRAMPLIRARVPDVQWVIIGEGPLRRDIMRLVNANHLHDVVRLLGSVDDAERDAWLDQAHVFCMPSRLPAGEAAGEGFGIVYLEAGLHGLPVVAGNVGGALDAVVHGMTGLLVDPTSPVALADAIADLLTDPERARRMGEAGDARAREHAWDRIAPQVERLLLDVIARRG
jgi:phosphatidylinositol alpha-1,6-mannosyltransferase